MKWYESEFACWAGQGICIFLTCVGIGTCSMLSYNTKMNIEVEQVEQNDNQ